MNYTELQNKTEVAPIEYIQYNKETVEDNKIKLFSELRNCMNETTRTGTQYPVIKALCSTYGKRISVLALYLMVKRRIFEKNRYK